MLRSLTKLSNKLFGAFGDKVPEQKSAKRKGDFIIIICHILAEKRIEIQAVDSDMQKITGFSAEYLTRKDFSQILPAHINEIIKDFLDDEDNIDLASVVKKIRDFSIISHDNREIPVNIRIVETTPMNGNPRYNLIMREIGILKAISASRDEIFKGGELSQIMDESVGLLSKNSIMKDLEIICFFVEKTKVKASFALIQIDSLMEIEQKIGINNSKKYISDIGKICVNDFRDEDLVGYLGNNKIAAILFDADADSSQIPLNRLRWEINAKTFKYDNKAVKPSVSVVYTDIKKGDKPEIILEKCSSAILGSTSSSLTHVK